MKFFAIIFFLVCAGLIYSCQDVEETAPSHSVRLPCDPRSPYAARDCPHAN